MQLRIFPPLQGIQFNSSSISIFFLILQELKLLMDRLVVESVKINDESKPQIIYHMATSKNNIPTQADYVFGRENYILVIGSFVIVLIGFLLMMGGGSDDPNVFNKEEIYSFRRITLAPVVVLFGYALGVYAIFKKAKE